MSLFRVGLTGGIASGKSTVARWLAEEGDFTVLDADRLIADSYAPGGEGARLVAEVFGDGVLDSEGAVDRPALGRLVFADPAARERLESLIHPLVRRLFDEHATAAGGIVVYEAALLVDTGQEDRFDLMVTVEADEEVRVARAVARGLDETEARSRLAAQISREERQAGADLVVENDEGLEELRSKTQELAAEIRRRAAAAAAAPPPRTIAILGASEKRHKYGNKAVRAYRHAGWTVYPIHRQASEIEGLQAYRSLEEVPGDLDRISVYLPPPVTLDHLDSVAARDAGQVWFNPGAADGAVRDAATEKEIPAVYGCSIVDIGLSPAQFP